MKDRVRDILLQRMLFCLGIFNSGWGWGGKIKCSAGLLYWQITMEKNIGGFGGHSWLHSVRCKTLNFYHCQVCGSSGWLHTILPRQFSRVFRNTAQSPGPPSAGLTYTKIFYILFTLVFPYSVACLWTECWFNLDVIFCLLYDLWLSVSKVSVDI